MKKTGPRWVTALLALAAFEAVAEGPRPPEEVPEPLPRLTLLVTSGLSGRLVDGSGEVTVAAVAVELRRLAAAARGRGDAVAIFDAGRTLLPYAESRHDGGRIMSRVLAGAGCQAFLPDAMDFTLGLDELQRLAADAPYPMLRPFEGYDPRLESFASHAVLELEGDAGGGLRLALVNLFDRFYEGNLAKSGIAAVLKSPEEALAAVPEEGLPLRVAVVHSAAKGSSMLSRKLTWELVEDGRGYDLLIDPDFGHDLVLHRQDEDGPVLLIGRRQNPEETWTVAEIVVDLVRHQGRLRPAAATLEIHGVDAAASSDADLEREILALVAEFRQAGARRLPAAAPASRDELITFVLETVREAAAAEVAVLNRGVFHGVDPELFEAGPLPEEALRRLLALDQFLVAGELSGAQLAALYGASSRRVGEGGKPRKSALIFRGLAIADSGGLKVNGRRLYPQDRYRVVTNSFLASGGDDYPALVQMEPAESVRLESGRLGEVREDFVLPRLERAEQPFVDLERRGLWRYGVDRFGLSVEGVRTSADPTYRTALDSRASADDSASLLATLRLRADQEWRSVRWENRLRARFGLIDAEGESSTELEDDLRLEISALFTGETFLGAQPYASLIFDSEIRKNQGFDGESLPRQLEQNLAAGLRWQTLSWPSIRLGLVARHQSDFEDADRLGVFAEAELSLGRRGWWPGIEGRFFAENLENSAATIRRVDAEFELRFPLGSALSFTPEFNFYLYDDSRLPGAARYHRLSLGLAYTWAGKYQRR